MGAGEVTSGRSLSRAGGQRQQAKPHSDAGR